MVWTPRPFSFYESFDDALADLRGDYRTSELISLYGEDGLPEAPEPSPEELLALYSRGFRGVRPETVAPAARKQIAATIGSMPRLYDVFPWARDIGRGKISAPDQAILSYDPEMGGYEAQTTSSCVSHSGRNAAECDYAMDALMGETLWRGRLCPEVLYRARMSNGEGWYCQALAEYVGPNGKGGFLYRKKYDGPGGEVVDLSKFSRETEKWASNGRNGVPKWLEDIARQNFARWVIPIHTVEEARDALAIGFGILGCSGLGFSEETDEFGVCRQRGSWSHAMAWQAVVDTVWSTTKYGGPIFKIQNSWGKYLKVNGKPEGFPIMSAGSFFARHTDIKRILAAGDTFAICTVRGYDRVGPEAFDVSALRNELARKDNQDYYHERSLKVAA